MTPDAPRPIEFEAFCAATDTLGRVNALVHLISSLRAGEDQDPKESGFARLIGALDIRGLWRGIGRRIRQRPLSFIRGPKS